MSKENEYYLTESGLEELKKELDYLKLEKRPQVIQALKDARALGDLSEKAIVIEQQDTDKVSIGSKVEIEYVEDKDKDEYTIVGTSEVDPFANKISNESPLAKAMIGHKINDVVTVICDAGNYQVKILNIA